MKNYIPTRKIETNISSKENRKIFIGREKELQIIKTSLDKAINSNGQICMIHGEAGYGKSLLLDYFYHTVLKKKKLVVLCHECCEDIFQHVSLYPLRKAFSSLNVTLKKQNLSSQNIPLMAPSYFDSAENLRTLYFKIGNSLKELAQRFTLVLIIDNAHWCDKNTLEFFLFFAKEIKNAPIQIILSFKEKTLEINNLRSECNKYISLEKLSNSLAINYLHQKFHPHQFSYVFMNKFANLTSGIPSHWEELTRFLLQEKEIIYKANTWVLQKETKDIYFPLDISSIVEDRLRFIMQQQKNHILPLEYASVLGFCFFASIWKDLIGKNKENLSKYIDKYQLIIKKNDLDGDQKYVFYNELFYKAVYQKIPAEKKQELHAHAVLYLNKEENRFKWPFAYLVFQCEKAKKYKLLVKYCYLAAKEEKRKLAYDNAIYFCMKSLPFLKKCMSEKNKILLCLAFSLIKEKELQKAKKYLLEILEQTSAETKDIINSLFLLAEAEKLEGKESDAKQRLNEIIDSKVSSHEQKVIGINKITQIYLKQREWGKALAHLNTGKKIASKIENKKYIGAVLYNLAKCYLEQGELLFALETYNDCVKIYEEEQNLVAIVQCYNYIAHIYSLQGLLENSIDFYEKTMGLLEQIDAQKQRIKVELDFAQVLLKRKIYTRSENLLKSSYSYYKNTGNLNRVAIVLCIQAELYAEMGNFSLAHKKLEESIEINKTQKDMVSQAMCIESIGIFFWKKEEWEKAKSKFKNSVLIWEAVQMKQKQAACLDLLGRCCWKQKQREKALEFFEESLQHSYKKFPEQQAKTLNSIAQIYYFQGNWKKTQESLKNSLNIQTKMGSLLNKSTTYSLLGNMYLKQGYFIEAETQYLLSYEIHKKLNDFRGQILDRIKIGMISIKANHIEDALCEFQKNIPLSKKIKDISIEAKIYEQIARSYYKQDLFSQAKKFLDKALSLKKNISSSAIANTYYYFGRCHFFAKEFVLSFEYFTKAKNIYVSTKNEYKLSKTLNNIGEVLIGQEEYLLAMEYFSESFILKNKMGDVEGLAYTYMHIGRVYMRLNRIDKATNNFEKSIVYWQTLGYNDYVAELSYQLGDLYEREEEIQQARNNFLRAYEYFKNINRKKLSIINQKLEELE